jgi:ectoine hydroxylase-related dioxygenase (phytanoyl-CoA dioxygenase family)
MTADALTTPVRAVADAERAAFDADGWVKLERLVSAADATRLYERAAEAVSARAAGAEPPSGTGSTGRESYRSFVRDDEAFSALALSAELGRVAAALLGCETSIRLVRDQLLLSQEQDAVAIEPHQDSAFLPIDRNAVTFWIALHEVTSDQIPLLFYTGSHRFGPLGVLELVSDEVWPRLRECPVGAPNRLGPGDATAHISSLVHSRSANAGPGERCGYELTLAPADSRYIAVPTAAGAARGQTPFERLDGAGFPLVYDVRSGPGSTAPG